MSPPEVVLLAITCCLRFVSQYDLLAAVIFLGQPKVWVLFTKTNACLFIDKKLAQTFSSNGRAVVKLFPEEKSDFFSG
jgi:hypothetical protein